MKFWQRHLTALTTHMHGFKKRTYSFLNWHFYTCSSEVKSGKGIREIYQSSASFVSDVRRRCLARWSLGPLLFVLCVSNGCLKGHSSFWFICELFKILAKFKNILVEIVSDYILFIIFPWCFFWIWLIVKMYPVFRFLKF